MPWTYAIDRECDVVLVTVSGILTGAELSAGARALIQDPGFHPDIRIFLDYHAVSEVRVSYDLVEAMASSRVYSAKSRRAFYVLPGFAQGVVRYYQAFAQAGQVEVFAERDAAVAWLNEGVAPEKWIE